MVLQCRTSSPRDQGTCSHLRWVSHQDRCLIYNLLYCHGAKLNFIHIYRVGFYFFFFIFPHVKRSWLGARVNVVIVATPTEKVGGCYQQTKGNPNPWLCGSNQLFPPKQILFGSASAQDLLGEGDAKPCFLAGVMRVDEAPEQIIIILPIHPSQAASTVLLGFTQNTHSMRAAGTHLPVERGSYGNTKFSWLLYTAVGKGSIHAPVSDVAPNLNFPSVQRTQALVAVLLLLLCWLPGP